MRDILRFIGFDKPLDKFCTILYFEFDTIFDVVWSVPFLIRSQILELFGLWCGVAEDITFNIQMLPNNQLFNCTLFKRRNRIRNAKTVLARVLTNLVKVWGYKCKLLVFSFFFKQNLQINFFSWINLTFCRSSATSSIAWLKPFSPPYETSTVRRTFALNFFEIIFKFIYCDTVEVLFERHLFLALALIFSVWNTE